MRQSILQIRAAVARSRADDNDDKWICITAYHSLTCAFSVLVFTSLHHWIECPKHQRLHSTRA